MYVCVCVCVCGLGDGMYLKLAVSLKTCLAVVCTCIDTIRTIYCYIMLRLLQHISIHWSTVETEYIAENIKTRKLALVLWSTVSELEILVAWRIIWNSGTMWRSQLLIFLWTARQYHPTYILMLDLEFVASIYGHYPAKTSVRYNIWNFPGHPYRVLWDRWHVTIRRM